MDYGPAGRTLRPQEARRIRLWSGSEFVERLKSIKFIFRSQLKHYCLRDPFLNPYFHPLGLCPCQVPHSFSILFFLITFYYICTLKYLFPLLDYELYEGKDCNCVVYCFLSPSFSTVPCTINIC